MTSQLSASFDGTDSCPAIFSTPVERPVENIAGAQVKYYQGNTLSRSFSAKFLIFVESDSQQSVDRSSWKFLSFRFSCLPLAARAVDLPAPGGPAELERRQG